MAAVEGVLMIGGLILKTYEQSNAASAQETALNLRAQQEKIVSDQRELQRANQLRQVISTQNANEAASGLSLASPSFNAIQIDSFNQFAKDEQLDALNGQMQQTAIAQQKENVNANFWAGVGNNLFDAGAYYMNTRVPNSGVGGTGGNSLVEDDNPPDLNQTGVGF